jgi:hypothetical protein
MARDIDQLAGFETENTGGVLSGFLAEEDVFDRRALWRLGSWGVASVGAVIIAIYTNQSSIASHRDQVAAADLARQSQQIQSVAKESQSEARRLASAVETLNDDRDRLYSRVTTLEQGLDSVTGAIARQTAATASPPPAPMAAAPTEPQSTAKNPGPAPAVAPVATAAPTVAKTTDKPPIDTIAPEQAHATVSSVAKASNSQASNTSASNTPASSAPGASPPLPLMAAKSIMAPPDAAAAKLIEPEKPPNAAATPAAPKPEVVAAAPPEDDAEADDPAAATPKLAVQRTEFGVDVGGANSVGGLRALWRGLLKSRSNAALTTLRPIIVIRESSSGLGMQLRLVAGPLSDAAAAAKICAGLVENDRHCETTVFDGQRLALNGDGPVVSDKLPAAKPSVAKLSVAKPSVTRTSARRRTSSRRVENDEPVKKPDPPSTLSTFFSRR